MKLAEMMETRHNMSQTVRAEVTLKSQAWGYQLGSVYIRKVHFRDVGMIHQIEEKVVNRLRQVTSAIRQAGSNQVSVITSSRSAKQPSSSPKRRPYGRPRWAKPSRKSPANRRWPRRSSTSWRRSGFSPPAPRSPCCPVVRTAACWRT